MSLSTLFLRLATTAPTLNGTVQQRIHRYAVLKKHEEIAAALARRADTTSDIDAELAGWSSAKVLAAWFSRPDRTAEQAAARVAREKRVTVLEVVAGLEGLPESVYAHCANRRAPRVAMPLLTNESAPVAVRALAASTIAAGFSELSYSRRQAVCSVLSTCPTPVSSSFVSGLRTVDDLAEAVKMAGDINLAAAQHVLDLCRQAVESLPARRQRKIDEYKNRSNRYLSLYEVTSIVRFAADAITAVVSATVAADLDFQPLFAAVDRTAETIRQSEERYTEDQQCLVFLDTISTASASCGASVGTNAQMARTSSDPDVLIELLHRSNDRAVAASALCNPNATREVAQAAMQKLNYSEAVRLLDARSRDMSIEVKAVIMSANFRHSDEAIRRVAAPHDPADLWRELIKQCVAHNRGVEQLLNSKHATPDIIPHLPLGLFSDESVLGWALAGLLAYLEEHLTTRTAWDGFEVLAPKHLGDVQTVVRAAARTSRHT